MSGRSAALRAQMVSGGAAGRRRARPTLIRRTRGARRPYTAPQQQPIPPPEPEPEPRAEPQPEPRAHEESLSGAAGSCRVGGMWPQRRHSVKMTGAERVSVRF